MTAQTQHVDHHAPVGAARLSPAMSVVIVVAAALLFVLGALYVILPARSIPALIPMFTPAIVGGHRYRQAVSAFAFSGILGYLSLLRWRLHAQQRNH